MNTIWKILIIFSLILNFVLATQIIQNDTDSLERDTVQMEYINTNQNALMELQKVNLKLLKVIK